jgi:hypothetical protein
MRKLSQQICKEIKKSKLLKPVKKDPLVVTKTQKTHFLYDEKISAVWCHTLATESEQAVKADKGEGLHVLDEVHVEAFKKVNVNENVKKDLESIK